MSEVMSALTKSQNEAQEMSESVMELAEELKQLRVSRAREETVRAKAASVGGAQRNWRAQRLNPYRKELSTKERICRTGGTQWEPQESGRCRGRAKEEDCTRKRSSFQQTAYGVRQSEPRNSLIGGRCQ